MIGGARARFEGLTEIPELNVGLFAFLLNYPWEFLQVPFYEGMQEARHWDAVLFCSRATVGDGVIAVLAFWGVAFAGRVEDGSFGRLPGLSRRSRESVSR
jgi:hypothetical protein